MIWLLTLLFALLPTYLIRFQIGPLPTTVLEILIWITIITWGFLKIKNNYQNTKLMGNWKFEINEKSNFVSAKFPLISISLFLVGATIGIFVSPNVRAALGEWKAFYVEPIIIALIVIDSVKNKEDVKKILGGLLLGSLTTAILGVYQHFTGWLVPHSFWANRDTYRVTGWYGFPNGVGLLLAPLIPIAMYVLWETKKEELRIRNQESSKQRSFRLNSLLLILNSIFLILAPFAIFFSKTTAAMVGLASGLGVLLLCFKKTRWPAVAFGIIGLMALFALPNNAITNELLAKDYSGQLRRDIWNETATYLKLNPITGSGIAGYSSEIAPFRHNKNVEVFHHPHNTFLTMWVNIGLIGLIGFVALLTWFYSVIIKNLKSTNRALAITLLVAMTIWLTMGLVDSPYIKNDWAMIFWLFIALAAYIKKITK